MTVHEIPLERRTLHGCFSRELEPILTVDAGELDHANARVLVPDDRFRRGVTEAVPVARALEPEPQPWTQKSSRRRTAAVTRSTDGM